jgi:hypothetical protein
MNQYNDPKWIKHSKVNIDFFSINHEVKSSHGKKKTHVIGVQYLWGSALQVWFTCLHIKQNSFNVLNYLPLANPLFIWCFENLFV